MAMIHIFDSLDGTHRTEKASGTLRQSLPGFDFSSTVILRAGERVTPDCRIKDDDIIFVRRLPEGATAAAVITVISVVVAVVAAGVGIGVSIDAQRKSEVLMDQYRQQQKGAEEKAAKVSTFPFLRGARNQSAMGNTIPFLMGEMYHTPYLMTSGYYSIEGEDGRDQYWNCALVSGYGPQVLRSLSLGSTRVKSFSGDTPQEGTFTFDGGSVYAASENRVEVRQTGELTLAGLSQKVSAEFYNEEVKHDYGQDAVEVIKEIPAYAQKIEIGITFNGLRAYSGGNWVERQVTVRAYWTNADNPSASDWHEIYFNFPGRYEWDGTGKCITLHSNHYAEYLESAGGNNCWPGKRKMFNWAGNTETHQLYLEYGPKLKTAVGGKSEVSWASNFPVYRNDYTKQSNGYYRPDFLENVPVPDTSKTKFIPSDNTLKKNTNHTIRYKAVKEFSAAESYGKNIKIKVVKATPALDTTSQETCVLSYVNTWHYDNQKSTASRLVACAPVEQSVRDRTTRIGIRLIANESTEGVLDEINVIAQGLARTWDGTGWSAQKKPTRNPAAWVLELLTSGTHPASRLDDGEIDLEGMGALYEWCEENGFHTDGIITKASKKKDIISSVLSSCGADLTYNPRTLRYEVVIDRPEDTPVALLNAQSVRSMKYAKSFARVTDGKKVTYIDRNSWQQNTEYFMYDGRTTKTDEETVEELAVEYVTEHDHAYKVAQRKMRQAKLQPREITVNVGREGDFYPLYSTVLLQMTALQQGLCSTVVHGVMQSSDGRILGLSVADRTEFPAGSRCGVILQMQNSHGHKIVYREVSKGARPTELIFTEPVVPGSDGIAPEYGNLVSFGLLDKEGRFSTVTNTMKITGISRGQKETIELTLKDYSPELYETGAIPDYTPNLTPPPQTSPVLPTQSLPLVSQSDLAEAQAAQMEALRRLSEGDGDSVVTAPDAPSGLTAVATEHKITLSAVMAEGGVSNIITRWVWELCLPKYETATDDDGEDYERRVFEWQEIGSTDTNTLIYEIGTLEADELSEWLFRCKAVNSSGLEGGYSSWEAADVTGYGTWKLQAPQVLVRVSCRTIQLLLSQPARADGRTVYGSIRHRVQVRRPASDPQGTYYKPDATGDAYTHDEAYKVAGDTTGYVTAQETYLQTMPLLGQSAYAYSDDGQTFYADAAMTKAADIPDDVLQSGAIYRIGETGRWWYKTKDIIDTQYEFRVTAFNEAGAGDAATVSATADCTNIRDLVEANETAKAAYIETLAAISAHLGEVAGSLSGNAYNYWTLEEYYGSRHKLGAFRVGDEKQGILVIPPHDEAEGIRNDTDSNMLIFRAGNFEITSEVSSITNETYLYDADDYEAHGRAYHTKRLKLSFRGIEIQLNSGTDDSVDANWRSCGRVQLDGSNNLIVANTDDVPEFGIRLEAADGIPARVYHFDTTTGDENGGNASGLTVTGTLTADPTSLFAPYRALSGTVEKTLTVASGALSYTGFFARDFTITMDGEQLPLSPEEDAWHYVCVVPDFSGGKAALTLYRADGGGIAAVKTLTATGTALSVTGYIDELAESMTDISEELIAKAVRCRVPFSSRTVLDPAAENFVLWAADASHFVSNLNFGDTDSPFYETMPIGSVVPFAGDSVPLNFLECDGGQYAIADYRQLYEAIGSTYNLSTDTDTTKFRVPDYREAVPVGVGTSTRAEAAHLSYKLGQFMDDQMQAPTVTLASSGSHNHGGATGAGGSSTDKRGVYGSGSTTVPEYYGNHTHSISTDGAHTHAVTFTARTGTVTRGKRIGARYIIKAKNIATITESALLHSAQDKAQAGKTWDSVVLQGVIDARVQEEQAGVQAACDAQIEKDREEMTGIINAFVTTYENGFILPVNKSQDVQGCCWLNV